MKLPRLMFVLAMATAVQVGAQAPRTLPAEAATKLRDSLNGARPHAAHVWRDAPPMNTDGTINGYIEIAKGDRRKWEFDIAANARTIDRMIPESIGGYPINYGIVPQTVSYDGDPFDILVLGPPIDGGSRVRGLPVGVMEMEDGGILDSKVVVSPVDASGRPLFQLTAAVKKEVGSFFERYKQHEPGASTRVPGWATPEQGTDLVLVTHAFFVNCRNSAGEVCTIPRPK